MRRTVSAPRPHRIAASIRWHNDWLTAEENGRVYGKCNNPYGHGHNYALEVTLAGPINAQTGMVYDLAALDHTVEQEVLERLDHPLESGRGQFPYSRAHHGTPLHRDFQHAA